MGNNRNSPEKDDYGVASMVLGIVGTVGIASLVCGILAVILGFMQRKRGKNGYATAGIVLGFVSLGRVIAEVILSVIYFAFILALFFPYAVR
ncbi:MAG: DUF4190 domain-containing protein [Clostridia bacterium]|nr:DUF4190 domain-containing protein [Clostridia bacterium]MBQ9480972.1 DUF4190 domain-containing protein [Clostridia bacterium]